ncbi:hypothetical protein SH1V18_45800 [Vallitalea longa]|uniref:G5 domain-containing protein n=1 Tax=Vallitalea longa TaxID=2936439 RepID=A0A9W6DGY1_9FIRM|nr:VanW family protein [Vallitalea longa]GKX32100.1 hypothetical protein SH1V18_45800 [Vallitalea longa]
MEELKNTNKKKKWIWITVIVAVVVIGAIVCYFFIRNNNMKEVVNRDVIYEGISIEGIDIGGLTKDEALDKMEDIIDEEIFDKEITISYKDKVYKKSYQYFEFKSNYLEVVDEAYNLFKTGSLKDRYNKIIKLKEDKIDYSVKNIYNEEKIKEFITSIKNDFNIEPKNAIIHRKNSEFIIDEEIDGLNLNVETNIANLKNAIDNFKEELTLVVEETKPQYTKEYYSNVKDVIGEYTTPHNNNKDRTKNLIIACNKMNGSIVYPGEDFATHGAISPISTKNGYKAAPIFVSGEVKDGLGGGICQVSTTLYNAVLMAELKVIERRNHSLPVTYVELGKDATMAGTQIDFVFENTTEYPVFIESYVQGGKVTIRLYGKEERDSNRRVEFKTEVIQKIAPPEPKYVKDSSLAPGQKITTKKGSSGYKVKLFKLIYVNDKLTDKQLINTSYYKPVSAIIKVAEIENPDGTMEADNITENEAVETINVIDDEESTIEDPENDSTNNNADNNNENTVENKDSNVDNDDESSADNEDNNVDNDDESPIVNDDSNIDNGEISVENEDSNIDNNDESVQHSDVDKEKEKPIDTTDDSNKDNENSNISENNVNNNESDIEDIRENDGATDEGVDDDEAGKSTGDRT